MEALLKVVKSVTSTQCDHAAAGADVAEDVPQGVKTDPQSENVDETGSGESWESPPEVQEGRGRMHAGSNPKVPAKQQWDAEAQAPEHDGAYFEQVTCLR